MENLSQKEDIRVKVKDYKDVIVNFAELLEAENSALAEFDTETVGLLYEQKVKLVTAYRSFVAYFIKNQEALRLLEDKERQELKEVSIHLDALLKDNSQLLQTRMETSKTIMDSIVNVAKTNSKANSTSYGCQGKYSPLDNSKNAIAINRTL